MEQPNNDGVEKWKEESIRKIDEISQEKDSELITEIKRRKLEQLKNELTELEKQKSDIQQREIEERFKKVLIAQVEQQLALTRQKLEEAEK